MKTRIQQFSTFACLLFALMLVQTTMAQDSSDATGQSERTVASQTFYAEGEWETEQGANTIVSSFDVYTLGEDAGNVLRASMTGNVATWACLSRDLLPQAQSIDLTSFDEITFTAYGMGDIHFFLNKASITDGDQYGYSFALDMQPTEYTLSLADLKKRSGETGFTAEDVTALVFFVLGNGVGQQPFALFVEDIRFTRSVAQSVSIEDGFEQPQMSSLEQNYPNPFNPQTTIGFSVPVASDVQLAVFDMLGREVEVLMNGVVASGRHEVTFEANNLPNGTYIYRLQANGETLTKTFVLMK